MTVSLHRGRRADLNRELKVGQQLAHAGALVDARGDQLQHVGDRLHGLCTVLPYKPLHAIHARLASLALSVQCLCAMMDARLHAEVYAASRANGSATKLLLHLPGLQDIAQGKEMQRKGYAARHHHESLCSKRQPWSMYINSTAGLAIHVHVHVNRGPKTGWQLLSRILKGASR